MRAGVAVHVVCAVARELAQAVTRVTGVTGASGKPPVHGSLSPENVSLGYDGSITLVYAAAPSGAKPAYLAPEQVTGGDVDRRADVFSLGIVLWELLTGTSLFLRDTASETRIAIVNSDLPGRRHMVRFLTAQQEQEMGDDVIVGRLCRPAPRSATGQTVP